MKIIILFVFLSFIAMSCETDGQRADRVKLNDSLTVIAQNWINNNRIDSAEAILKPLVANYPYYNQKAGLVLKEINEYKSDSFMLKKFEGLDIKEYKQLVSKKTFTKRYFQSDKLDSLFIIKLKVNSDKGLDIIKKQQQKYAEAKKQIEQNNKYEAEQMSIARKSYETTLRNNFLDNSLDIEVKVSGKNNTNLTLSYALFNAVWARKFQTEGLVDTFKKNGFKKVTITDNYDYTVYWDLND